MACCDSGHSHHVRAGELEDMAHDPTLQSCCRRDLEQQAATSRITAALAQQDRSMQRLEYAAAALNTGGNIPADPWEARNEPRDSNHACEDEDCAETAELAKLREQRLSQLRDAALRQQAASLQYGSLHQVLQDEALELIKLAKYSVGHLPAAGNTQVADEIDQLLQSLANRQQGTLFLRTQFDSSSALARYCRMPGPGMVCLRSGRPVTAASYLAFSEGGLLQEEVLLTWMQEAGVLQQETPSVGQPPPPPPQNEDDGSEESEDDWDEPCNLCGRRYQHEHVQAQLNADRDSD